MPCSSPTEFALLGAISRFVSSTGTEDKGLDDCSLDIGAVNGRDCFCSFEAAVVSGAKYSLSPLLANLNLLAR